MADFLRHHFYDLCIPVGAVACYYLNANRRTLSTSQKWLAASFIAVLVHQVEEYRFPGGFPAAMNMGLHNSVVRPEGYPLNAHSAMITNCVATYLMYLPPVFLPDPVWLGLGPIFLGFGQILIHGININKAMGSFYNPGVGTTFLMHVPIGIAYLYHLRKIGKLTLVQFGLGLLYGWAIMFFLLGKYTFGIALDLDTPYPFSYDEMHRGGVRDYILSVRK